MHANTGFFRKNLTWVITVVISLLTTVLINTFWLGAYYYRMRTVEEAAAASVQHIQDPLRHVDPVRDSERDRQLMQDIKDMREEIKTMNNQLNQLIGRWDMRYPGK